MIVSSPSVAVRCAGAMLMVVSGRPLAEYVSVKPAERTNWRIGVPLRSENVRYTNVPW